MDSQPDHPLQPFWHLASAALQAKAVSLALEHRLFVLLATPASAQDVASQLGLRPVACSVWLDMLWSLGLLTRSPGNDAAAPMQYANATLAQRWFHPDSPESCGEAWQYRVQVLQQFAEQMAPLLAPEASVPATVRQTGTWAQAARAQIGQEQRAVTVPAVLQCLPALGPLPAQGRFLDLGGGPGHVALALAEALPGWHGTVCDLPDTVAVARDNIAAAGLAARVDVLAANLDLDPIGTGYDLIWCSSVLHFLEDPQAMLRTLCQGLRPGGRLLLAHAEVAHDPAVAAQVLPFYAPMMLRGKYVPRQGEMMQALTEAGFMPVQALGRLAFPLAPVWLYVGTRP